MRKIIFIFLLTFLIIGCRFNESVNNAEKKYIDCPADIANGAFYFAQQYINSGIPYVYGGQSPLRSAGIDCSGLVVMCYKYALVDTKYSLIQTDMSTAYMYDYAITKTNINNLRKGDLIFFVNDNSINHLGIFSHIENDNIYFIDSTKIEAENINGVTLRHFPLSDNRIKGGGIMRLISN